ncbi:MAG: pilus assembly protein PilP [Deltaproteobacteria bacterium]|nr:pilus assembly protein PilP [Deltaproteobacteria bacterium]NCP96347.1 pilus assembly protein PilP [Deltaproteobacteria bacterium]NCS74540.1 pilus assembly protein PilP [Deltaproteobacteria bacterium]
MSTILNILLVVVSCALLGGVGCGKGAPQGAPPQAPANAPAPAPTEEQKPVAAGPAEEAVVEAEYAYHADGRRDPFESLIKGTEVATAAPKEEGPFVAVVDGGGDFSPLERYEMEELRLVGIVDAGGSYRGLVEVADGKSYFLGSGARVGRNGGVVSRVLEDRVVITETYRNPLGETRTKDVYLTFTKTGGD